MPAPTLRQAQDERSRLSGEPSRKVEEAPPEGPGGWLRFAQADLPARTHPGIPVSAPADNAGITGAVRPRERADCEIGVPIYELPGHEAGDAVGAPHRWLVSR